MVNYLLVSKLLLYVSHVQASTAVLLYQVYTRLLDLVCEEAKYFFVTMEATIFADRIRVPQL